MSNLADLRSGVGLWVNFNPDEPDQDFGGTSGAPWYAIDKAINWAYRDEVKRGMNEVSTDWVRRVETFSWGATDIEKALPASIVDKRIYAFMDETSVSPGDFLWVQSQQGSRQPTIFWRDRLHLQWGTTGPGEDKTIAAFYFEEPNKLVNPTDIPDLMPSRHHDLIEVSAAVHLRVLRDDFAPPAWLQAQLDQRLNFWNDLMNGQPAYPARYAIIDPYLGNQS